MTSETWKGEAMKKRIRSPQKDETIMPKDYSILRRIQDKWFLCKKCHSPTESVTVYAETKDGRGFTWNKPHRACLNCNLIFRESPIKSFPLSRLGLIRLKRVRLVKI